jgi:hypothetical protein
VPAIAEAGAPNDAGVSTAKAPQQLLATMVLMGVNRVLDCE